MSEAREAGARGVVVWWASCRPIEELDLAPLSAEERARVGRLTSPSAQERSALARVVLRAALSDALGGAPSAHLLDWTAGPRLVEPGSPELSLTHSGSRVVVAISTCGRVGVDVELEGRELSARLVEKVTTADERCALALLSPDDRSRAEMQLWTAKEAVLKATRDGLRIAPDRVEVGAVRGAPVLTLHGDRPELVGACQLTTLARDPDYVGTLAVLAGTAPAVDERDGDALLS